VHKRPHKSGIYDVQPRHRPYIDATLCVGGHLRSKLTVDPYDWATHGGNAVFVHPGCGLGLLDVLSLLLILTEIDKLRRCHRLYNRMVVYGRYADHQAKRVVSQRAMIQAP